MTSKKTFVIDGVNFLTLEEFYDEIGRVLIPSATWGKNLDAFNDILRGGFGTPDEGFILIWKNSNLSRKKFGYAETIKQLEEALQNYHSSNRESLNQKIIDAKEGRGETIFDWLIGIIKTHCPDGEESEDGIELILD